LGGRVLTRELSPVLKITTGTLSYAFTKEMEGGYVYVPAPISALPQPRDTAGESYVTSSDYAYNGTIKEVLSSTTVALENPFQRLIEQDGTEKTLQYTKFNDSVFYVSYSEDSTYSQSEAYDSHVYVEMGNISPITGDVYKIKAYTKTHSDPHTFTYIGEHILESSNLFIDTGSITTTDGIGIFNTLETLDFWTSSSINSAPQAELFTSSLHVIEGLHISSSENSIASGYVNVETATYRNRYFGEVGYQLSLNVFGEARGQEAELEIILSGSTILGGGELQIGEIKIPTGGQKTYTGLSFPFRTNLHGYGKPVLRVKSGNWHVGDIKIQPIHQVGFAPEHTIFTLPIDTRWDSDILDFKFEFYNYEGEMCETFLTYTNANFQYGPAFYIQGSDNLVTGSLYIGNVIGEGIEAAGANSAYIRNIGYDGWASASSGDGGYGFMMWSGSVMPGTTDNYDGVGIELIGQSGSLRFRTNPSLFEVIADQFFIGSTTSQFISGAGGNLEISSSDFWLQSDGTLIIYGSASVDSLYAPATPPYKAAIYSDGRAVFTSASIGGWQINENEIFTDNLTLSSSGIIRSDTSGQRVIFNDPQNYITFYDSSNWSSSLYGDSSGIKFYDGYNYYFGGENLGRANIYLGHSGIPSSFYMTAIDSAYPSFKLASISGSNSNGYFQITADGSHIFQMTTYPLPGETYFSYNGSERFLMSSSGDFHADGNLISYSTTIPSDFILKHKIREVEPMLNSLLQLSPVNYEWKREDKPGSYYGFIAQDMEKIFPSIVKEVDDIFNLNQNVKTIDYIQLIPILVQSIQELKQELNELKST